MTVALAELLVGSASASADDIVKLMVFVPSLVAVTPRLRVVFDSAAKFAPSQSIWVLLTEQVPSGQLALSTRNPGDSAILSVIPVASRIDVFSSNAVSPVL